MRPIRFCFVTTFYPPQSFGGDAVAVQRLARALVRRGHVVTVLHDGDAFRMLAPAGVEPSPATGGDGVEVIELRSPLGALGALLTQQTGRPLAHGARIRRILARGDFDVVNFHNVSLIGGPGVLPLAGEAVSIYTAHEHWLVCPTHVLWRYDQRPCPGRRCFRCQIAHGRPPQLFRLTGYLERQLDSIDGFVAMSDFSRRKHAEFGFPAPMTVLPPFLPEPAPPPSPDEPPHPRPYALFAGRLERIKGLDDVIPLFRGLQGLDLVIAGSGSHGGALRRLAQGMPGVHFLGTVSQGELDRWYRHAVALLATSACFETFGLTVIEAFRHGTPVVARRLGPLPDIVETAGGGLVFDGPRDLEPMLARLRDEPGLRRDLGERARSAFLQHWSEGVVVPRYLELVHALARAKGHRLAREAATAAHVEGW